MAMWIEAVDLLLTRIHESEGGKELLARVAAISGAAQVRSSPPPPSLVPNPVPQQHASVYWSTSATTILSSLDPSQSLASQLSPAFASPLSPNWQDSSTTAECREMEAAAGGVEAMAQRTGSRAHERFTGVCPRPPALRSRADGARNSPRSFDFGERTTLFMMRPRTSGMARLAPLRASR